MDTLQATQVNCNTSSGLVTKPITENTKTFGNPVFNYQPEVPVQLPAPQRTDEERMAGYSTNPVNVLYKTTSSAYGWNPPTVHTVPLVFYSKTQRFSDDLGKCGMPRNRGLNCSLDKSRVPNH